MPDSAYYWQNNAGGCFLSKTLCYTPEEFYKKRRPVVSGWVPYNDGVHPYQYTGGVKNVSFGPGGRYAGYIANDGSYDYIFVGIHSVDFGEQGFYNVGCQFEYEDTSYVPPMKFLIDGCPSGTGLGPLNLGLLATNIPIFETQTEADYYIVNGTFLNDVKPLNYEGAEVEPDKTEVYYCYNMSNTGQMVNGVMTETDTQDHRVYRNIRVQANRAPALYFVDSMSFQLGVKYPEIISWYGNQLVEAPENIPVENFNAPPISGFETFYANMYMYQYARDFTPNLGIFTYGFKMNTNFKLFKNETDADYYIKTGDDGDSIDYPDTPDNPDSPDTGDPDPTTDFGPGGFLSPFIQSYVMNVTGVGEVADAFYSDDDTVIANIERGLKLFGSEPFEAIVGLSAFPFDVSTICTTVHTNGVYFGSYRQSVTDAWKITGMDDDYIDAGTINVGYLVDSEGNQLPEYRNFEPYASLHVYLPYVGWEKLQIEDYIGKTVNIRYYIDIYTRSGVCVLVADGALQDYFPVSCIGVELPITGQNLSRYANDTLNALLGMGAGVVGGAVAGSMLPGVGTAFGAATGALISGGIAVGKGTFDIAQKGKPKDHNLQKGSFSANTGCYMPQYVIFRFDVHDIIEPDKLNEIYGKPSSYSGPISNLNGFVKAETMKMNTSGMSDSIINEVTGLLNSGIYV